MHVKAVSRTTKSFLIYRPIYFVRVFRAIVFNMLCFFFASWSSYTLVLLMCLRKSNRKFSIGFVSFIIFQRYFFIYLFIIMFSNKSRLRLTFLQRRSFTQVQWRTLPESLFNFKYTWYRVFYQIYI